MFPQPSLGKGIRLTQAGGRLHGRGKNPPLAQKEKVQAEKSGWGCSFWFHVPWDKGKSGLLRYCSSWCAPGTRWTGKDNSKCLPCLYCMSQSVFTRVSTTGTRDRNLFCYRNSQIFPISKAGATTRLNIRHPKPDSSEAKWSWIKWVLQMQSKKIKREGRKKKKKK